MSKSNDAILHRGILLLGETICVLGLAGCISILQPTLQTGQTDSSPEEDNEVWGESFTASHGDILPSSYEKPAYTTDGEDGSCCIMNKEEIDTFNQAVINQEELCVTDITQVPAVLSGEKVKHMILGFGLPDKPYIDGENFTQEMRQMFTARLDEELAVIEDDDVISVQYAIAVRNTDIRSYPTDSFVTDERGVFDYFQESMQNIGEPAAIYATTSDGQWCFAITPFCSGWMKSEDLGLCSLAQIEEFYTREKVIVFLQGTNLTEKVYIRPGTSFAYEDGKLMLPVSSEGRLSYEPLDVPSELLENPDVISFGYLCYNEENMLAQMERMLGMKYGWGDMNEDMDCSSTAQAIYRCFGIRIPRNTSWQRQMPSTVVNIRELSRDEKMEVIENLPVGALIFMDGHVMIYAGMEEGEPMIIHNVTRHLTETGEEVNIYGCVKTPLGLINTAGNSYYDAIHTIVVVE